MTDQEKTKLLKLARNAEELIIDRRINKRPSTRIRSYAYGVKRACQVLGLGYAYEEIADDVRANYRKEETCQVYGGES